MPPRRTVVRASWAVALLLSATGPAGRAVAAPSVYSAGGEGRTRTVLRLDGDTLRPLEGTVEVRGLVRAVETSPDRRYAAVSFTRRARSYVTVIDRRRWRAVWRSGSSPGWAFEGLAWMRPNRLLGISRSGFAAGFTVAAFDPVRRIRLRVRTWPGGVLGSARVGTREVVVAGGTSRPPVVRVFGPSGRQQRAVELSRLAPDSYGLSLRPAGGKLLILASRASLVAIVDARTGGLTYRDVHLGPPDGIAAGWLEADVRGQLGVVTHELTTAPVQSSHVLLLDPETFAVERDRVAEGLVLGTGDGYATWSPPLTASPARISGYDLDGRLRWHALDGVEIDAPLRIGRRIYARTTPGITPQVRTFVVDAATGRELGVVPTAPTVLVPSNGVLPAPMLNDQFGVWPPG
jgi:hypothetical protein